MGNYTVWDSINDRLYQWLQLIIWHIMPGTVVELPRKEGTLVVEYGHPLWYDVGAARVEAWTDHQYYQYEPWLLEHAGREYLNWQLRVLAGYRSDGRGYTEYVQAKFRCAKVATLATLTFG